MDAAPNGTAMIDRLFVPWERWGWEFVPPSSAAPSPDLASLPTWTEPIMPSHEQVAQHLAAQRQDPRRRASAMEKGCLGYLLGFGLIGLMVGIGRAAGAALALTVLLVIIVLIVLVTVSARKAAVNKVVAKARAARDAQYQSYLQARAACEARIAEHDTAERHRIQAAILWHPVTLASRAPRVDVFGGTADGWASLLVTVGSSLLHTGAITVFDLTEQSVAGGLAAFAASRGVEVRQLELCTRTPEWDLLAGVEAGELAELLSDAVHGVRGSGAGTEARTLDSELFEAVLARLDRPWTFTRIAAGLTALRRIGDGERDGLLSAAEMARLTLILDEIGQDERVGQELRFLSRVLEPMTRAEHAGGMAATQGTRPDGRLRAPGMLVVSTLGERQRHKEMLDQVVFHRLLLDLRVQRNTANAVLVVAGADQLGRDSLEHLARRARMSGIRLILMLEHLRGDLHDLLGGPDSATVLMRLGNGREAASAAEFVGRGHRFVLSQLTEQVGHTFTRGISASTGGQEGYSYATGRGSSVSFGGFSMGEAPMPVFNSSTNRSSTFTDTRSRTWQNTVNESTADSATSGATGGRVYEFIVEPTVIQALPPTAFILVEVASSGRRVVSADCNPGIVLLDKVAPEPPAAALPQPVRG